MAATPTCHAALHSARSRFPPGSITPGHPLAYAQPFLQPAGRAMLATAQQATGLDEELWMVIPSGQGAPLTPPSRRFTAAIKYPDLVGPAEYLITDQTTPTVVFHPARREGQPTVHSIRAETIAELVAAGEPMEFVASTYDLDLGEVEQAVIYEASRRRAA